MAGNVSAPASPGDERRLPQASWLARVRWLALAVYVAYAVSLLDITWERFYAGLGHGARFVARMLPPDFTRWELLLRDLAESVEIAIISSAFGILLSLPIGLLAARNMMPLWVTWPARALIAVCRSFHPVIVAILFVKAVGFGALAGILALIVASVGFIAKLFAEAIEEISMKQVEAVRASGAPFLNVITFGVLPQVLSRFIGFSSYQLDSNFRVSTVVGIVGGGGIGGTLFAAFQRFDYDFVCAILLSIIALIMVVEVFSARLRATFQ